MSGRTRRAFAVLAMAAVAASCSGDDSGAPDWAVATATIDGTSYEVEDVVLELVGGEGEYFNLSGDPVEDDDVDCVTGLSGGMNLYGDLDAVDDPASLVGQALPIEFSGDGDDANLCFVGTNGLLGAQSATLTIDAVDGDRAQFTVSGTFDRYDEMGNSTTVQVTGTGTALVEETVE